MKKKLVTPRLRFSIRFSLLLVLLIGVLPILITPASLNSYNGSEAVVLDLSINIDGGALTLWERVLKSYGNKVLIIKVNSYGGYLSVADRIVSDILSKGIECYVWIPPGGYAVSAAAMISLACRGIYMGSASVIGNAIPSPSDQKTAEYVASRFKSLAERMFNYNKSLVEVAEAMVREGKTLTAEEAVALGFARRAESLNELERILGINVVGIVGPSPWDRLVSILSLPVVTGILLVAGAILIIVEILTTGFQGYAIAGALLIALALYGMNIITPDIFALVLMLAGVVLLAIEMYTPGFGIFGLSGIALLAIGTGYQLYLTPPHLLSEPVYAVLAGLLSITGLVCFVAYKALQTSRRRRPSLEQQLLASTGIAKTDIGEVNPGVVYVLGEEWTAYSVKGTIPAGSKVKVVRVEGLKLYVEKLE